MNRVSVVVDEVEKKVKSLNGVFNVISSVSSRVNFIYDGLKLPTIKKPTIETKKSLPQSPITLPKALQSRALSAYHIRLCNLILKKSSLS